MPEEYRDFFVAATGAAGALIGLLFVAVSVFPEHARQTTTRVQFHSRASAALLVFTNALVISLAGLVPGVSLGWWAVIAGGTVILFALGTARSVAAAARRREARGDAIWLVLGLLMIGGFEVHAGTRLITGFDLIAVQTLNYVVIGDLAYGISRAWQLVGLRNTGLWSSLLLIAGRDARLGD
jgi:hypothetical protein